jgi:small multidrug resistance family-3 protein
MSRTALVYVAAALAEIGGCFGFWLWLREGKSAWLLPASLVSLTVFAWLLTLTETTAAGRAYAAYGGVYIVASICWLWQIENIRPDRWDIIGASICLLGAAVILFGPRAIG